MTISGLLVLLAMQSAPVLSSAAQGSPGPSPILLQHERELRELGHKGPKGDGALPDFGFVGHAGEKLWRRAAKLALQKGDSDDRRRWRLSRPPEEDESPLRTPHTAAEFQQELRRIQAMAAAAVTSGDVSHMRELARDLESLVALSRAASTSVERTRNEAEELAVVLGWVLEHCYDRR